MSPLTAQQSNPPSFRRDSSREHPFLLAAESTAGTLGGWATTATQDLDARGELPAALLVLLRSLAVLGARAAREIASYRAESGQS
jgi:hypothetical protein